MRLNEIRTGETIFIDSNIFIYHFTGVSEESTLFLGRCEKGELAGFTGINIIVEVLHRLMMIEAVTKGLVTPGNVAKKLKMNPEVVKRLTDYEINALSIPEMGIETFSLSEDAVKSSSQFRRKYGFMVNDSLTAAMMDMEGITSLATLDKDFGGVKEIDIYSPEDVV